MEEVSAVDQSYSLLLLSLLRNLWATVPEPEEDEFGEDDEMEDLDLIDVDGKAEGDFVQIISDMVTSGYTESHPADSLLMEIKGYKFAQNKAYADCIAGAVTSLLAAALADGLAKPTEFLKKMKELLAEGAWGHRIIAALIQSTTDERPEAVEE